YTPTGKLLYQPEYSAMSGCLSIHAGGSDGEPGGAGSEANSFGSRQKHPWQSRRRAAELVARDHAGCPAGGSHVADWSMAAACSLGAPVGLYRRIGPVHPELR